jgi:hypothetical protein
LSSPSELVGTLSALKTAEQQRARELRTLGWSVKEIERHLGVSRGSVSTCVRDVPLDASARARLSLRVSQGPIVAAERKRARAQAVRSAYQADGRLRARRGDPSYAAGCMLYWAEGDKCRNAVRLSNSDPDLVAVFVEFLRRHFDVPDDRLTVRCNLFADHLERQAAVEDFWLDRLHLPRASLRRSTVNVYSKYSQKKRQNKLPYGTCKVVVHSTQIVQTIYGSIQEYGGFERPEWLD